MVSLRSYLKPYDFKMALGLFIKFFGTIMDLLLPWALAHMIDDVVPLKSVSQIFLWGGLMFLCAFIGLMTNITANRMASKVASGVTLKLRQDLFIKISTLSNKQVDFFTMPSLISRLTHDTYNVHKMVGLMQRQGVRAPILLLGGIIVTISLEPVLSMVLFCIFPFAALLMIYISKKGIPLFTGLQEASDLMVLSVREHINGIRVIKALSKSAYEKEKFMHINEEVSQKAKKANRAMAITNPAVSLLLNTALSAVILLGAFRVSTGQTQTGKIISFLSYFTIILSAMMAINRMFILYSKGRASAQRIEEVLNTPEDLCIHPIDYKNMDDAYISFENVSFSYNHQKNNIENMSFSIKKGETLGIIGGTGSGKTTIINLLLRLYDSNQGEIRINGQSIKSMPWEILYGHFGVVFQDDILFAEAIKENIAFGRAINNDQLEKAAGHAQATDFILNKEGGFNFALAKKGANLSGGQKQRLLIARALANHPEILILDDSASALDYNTDLQLRQALSQYYKETTKIIIAQRISSILTAEKILVLEEGKIIGMGTHTQLMNTCQFYQQIYENQMGDNTIAK